MRLETERQGARETAAVEGLEWVDDWFDGGGGDFGLEMDIGGDDGGKDAGEADRSADEQEGRGRVFLSPLPGAEVEGGQVPLSEKETKKDDSMTLPFRGFVLGAEIW